MEGVRNRSRSKGEVGLERLQESVVEVSGTRTLTFIPSLLKLKEREAVAKVKAAQRHQGPPNPTDSDSGRRYGNSEMSYRETSRRSREVALSEVLLCPRSRNSACAYVAKRGFSSVTRANTRPLWRAQMHSLANLTWPPYPQHPLKSNHATPKLKVGILYAMPPCPSHPIISHMYSFVSQPVVSSPAAAQQPRLPPSREPHEPSLGTRRRALGRPRPFLRHASLPALPRQRHLMRGAVLVIAS